MLYRPNSRWTWVFFTTIFTQAVVVIALEVTMLALFRGNLLWGWADSLLLYSIPESKPIPVSCSLVILGCIYELILIYDTLAQQNTIQVIGICVYSMTLCIYNGLQLPQVNEMSALEYFPLRHAVWPVLRGLAVATVIITAAVMPWVFVIGLKLYREFAWVVFRQVEANIVMRRRYLFFQIFVSLLKFDGFYFLGTLVQIAVARRTPTNIEDGFYGALALIPAVCILLFVSASMVRHEKPLGTLIIILLHSALLAFFLWQLTTWYRGKRVFQIVPVRRTLTFFGVMTVILSVCTIGMAWVCSRNFSRGLKPYIMGDRKARQMGDSFEMELQVYERLT